MLTEPYTHLAGEIDGRKAHQLGLLPGDPLWNELPDSPDDRWSSLDLAYHAPFSAGGVSLTVRDYDGRDVDWFGVDAPAVADGEVAPTQRPSEAPRPRTILPGRLSYPGAPKPRWWEIEDHEVDVGGFSPDRSHFGSMLLLDVALAHRDDWFWFPVLPAVPQSPANPPPSSGVVVTQDDWYDGPRNDEGAACPGRQARRCDTACAR